MDANLEEAATILKASRFKIIRRITLPIVMPALLSTFLLVFSSSMSAYAVPQFLGGTDGFAVLTTTMKQFVNSGWYGQGYIMAVFMIIFGVSILAINQYMTGKESPLPPSPARADKSATSKWDRGSTSWQPCWCCFSLFTSILPLITFALESMCVKPGDYSTFTLDYWFSKEVTGSGNGIHGLIYEPQVWNALKNSLLLALCCALIAGTLGILIGYAVAKRRGTKLARLADNLAFLPYLMPSMGNGARRSLQ